MIIILGWGSPAHFFSVCLKLFDLSLHSVYETENEIIRLASEIPETSYRCAHCSWFSPADLLKNEIREPLPICAVIFPRLCDIFHVDCAIFSIAWHISSLFTIWFLCRNISNPPPLTAPHFIILFRWNSLSAPAYLSLFRPFSYGTYMRSTGRRKQSVTDTASISRIVATKVTKDKQMIAKHQQHQVTKICYPCRVLVFLRCHAFRCVRNGLSFM